VNTRVVIAIAVGVGIMKIFGNKGILITLTIIGLILGALYLFQNKLLYMPGTSLSIKLFLTHRFPPSIIRKDTDTPLNRVSHQKT
jgi:hypothetical protein